MKKSIVIKEENRKRITEELNAIQVRCTMRIATVEQVYKACDILLKKFKITKKAMNGCTFIYRPFATTVPAAYKYRYIGTTIMLTVKNGNFQLVDCYRDDCGNIKVWECRLTEEAKKAILNNYERFN